MGSAPGAQPVWSFVTTVAVVASPRSQREVLDCTGYTGLGGLGGLVNGTMLQNRPSGR